MTIVVYEVGPCVAFPVRDSDEDCDELRERLVRFAEKGRRPQFFGLAAPADRLRSKDDPRVRPLAPGTTTIRASLGNVIVVRLSVDSDDDNEADDDEEGDDGRQCGLSRATHGKAAGTRR